MKPSDLHRFMPDVDFGIPHEEVMALPELPEFTEALRKRIEREVTLYDKPVLSISNLAWGHLYLILAAHEQRRMEAEGLDAVAPVVLPRDSRSAVEDVHLALKRAQKQLVIALQQNGVARLLEGKNGSVADRIQDAIETIDAALDTDARRRSSGLFEEDDDGSGRLEFLLAQWWQQYTGKSPSLSKGNKKNGDPPAYVSFLRLCFCALPSAPSVGATADVILTRRKRHEADEDALKTALRTIRRRFSAS